MNWLLDHLQFVIIIAFAFASWLKHRSDTKNAEAEERRAREEMADDETDFGPEDNWEIPQRPPAPSVPPPLVRQATPPPIRVEVSEIEAILERQRDMQDRLQQIKGTRATTTGNAAATRARVAAAGKPKKAVIAAKTSLRGSLQDPDQTRRAIVLREILGPPVGLR